MAPQLNGRADAEVLASCIGATPTSPSPIVRVRVPQEPLNLNGESNEVQINRRNKRTYDQETIEISTDKVI